ncbi:hypothetical protein H9W95_01660 [Flavobacterium lindanitolerans]|nr:hypothetical protein [Flavobacterium lindanitolerans]
MPGSNTSEYLTTTSPLTGFPFCVRQFPFIVNWTPFALVKVVTPSSALKVKVCTPKASCLKAANAEADGT